MSGSGSSGIGVGGGNIGTEEDCSKIFESTVLNSPNPDILEKLKPDDELEVSILDEAGNLSLVAKYEGEIAGSITTASVAQIIKCIQDGNDFVAIVISIDSGRCLVEIRPKSN